MSGFEHDTISIKDLRAGSGQEVLTEAEVIIAVDADAQEEVLRGKWDWELAVGTGHEAELSVVRVELETSDDVNELREMLRAAQSETDDGEEEPTADDDTNEA
ncbi:MAG: hypothetical protein PVI86_08405 [Phycisphaerae bacterium]|jgi:hypothetical protein